MINNNLNSISVSISGDVSIVSKLSLYIKDQDDSLKGILEFQFSNEKQYFDISQIIYFGIGNERDLSKDKP